MVEITAVMMILFFVRIQKSTAEQMQLASQKSTADQKEATFNGIKKSDFMAEKLSSVTRACFDEIQTDESFIPSCLIIINDINKHVDQFFTEERANIEKILIVNNATQIR